MRATLALLVALAVSTASGVARAEREREVVDRIVAVVDEVCITSSELERSARPFVKRVLDDPALTPAAREDALEAVRREVLQRLVEHALVEKHALRIGLGVTGADVDAAIDHVASIAKLSREDLFAAAAKQGMDAAAYREELRRQLVEGKVLWFEHKSRFPKESALPAEQHAKRMAEVRVTVIAELRAAAYVDERT